MAARVSGKIRKAYNRAKAGEKAAERLDHIIDEAVNSARLDEARRREAENIRKEIREKFPKIDLNVLRNEWRNGNTFIIHTAVESSGKKFDSMDGINMQDFLIRRLSMLDSMDGTSALERRRNVKNGKR